MAVNHCWFDQGTLRGFVVHTWMSKTRSGSVPATRGTSERLDFRSGPIVGHYGHTLTNFCQHWCSYGTLGCLERQPFRFTTPDLKTELSLSLLEILHFRANSSHLSFYIFTTPNGRPFDVLCSASGGG